MIRKQAKPWRQVFHAKHRRGPRGGSYWALVLDCGHLVIRQATTDYDRSHNLYRRQRPRPKKALCDLCAAGAPERDAETAVEMISRTREEW